MARTGRWIFGCQIYFPNLNTAFHPVHPLHSYINDEIRPKTISTLKGVLLSHGPPARGIFQKSDSIFIKEIPFHFQSYTSTWPELWQDLILKSWITNLISCSWKRVLLLLFGLFGRQILGCRALACTGGVCVVEADSCPFPSCSSIEK